MKFVIDRIQSWYTISNAFIFSSCETKIILKGMFLATESKITRQLEKILTEYVQEHNT
jgi:hypothetical protein